MTQAAAQDSSSQRPAGVAGVFDRVADTYDSVGVPWFGPIALGLVRALDPHPGERVLDIGCGKGAALLPLAQAVGETGHATGIDLSPRMVAAATTAARAAALRNVDVQVADAGAPGLDEGGFDVVAASLVLFFLPDPAAALAGWSRLLRPGGRLGISTFGPAAPIWEQVDDVFQPYLPQQLLDARTSGRRGPFGSDEGVESLFLSAGLTAVRTVTAGVDAVLRDLDHWYEFSWSHGQRALWECVPEVEREAVRRKAYRVLEGARGDDGAIHLGQQVRYTLGVAG
ncbi:class I SAM-dependent methyltransferase [Angustibacter sp. McL0619]|uniref:class I SAM-dependent methyltransferase n=1 Tax=Angustibacter sp. McL0619 TaxID=3415676 RepID=UPI003CE93AC2